MSFTAESRLIGLIGVQSRVRSFTCAPLVNTYLCSYMVKPKEDKRLVSLSLQQFVKSVGARTAAPGGGSVSAAIAAMVGKRFHESSRSSRRVMDGSFYGPGGSAGSHGGTDDIWKEAV